MILGIGVDIVSNSRFNEMKEGLLRRLFTSNELDKASLSERMCEFYASRFAAKEAFAKALGTGFRGISPKDIEIIEDELGKPSIRLMKDIKMDIIIHLSISHERDSSIAMVVIEDGKK